MTEVILPLGAISKSKKLSTGGSGKKRTMWNFTALICYAVGVSSAISGLFMNGVGLSFETGNTSLEMNKIGTILIGLAFPLTLFGAHALDKIAEYKRQRAIERTAYKENE